MRAPSALNNLAGIFSTRKPPVVQEVEVMLAALPGAARSETRWHVAAGLVGCETSCVEGCVAADPALESCGADAESGAVVFVDGRIENRAELEAVLGAKGASIRRLLQRGYEQLGQDVVARLRGAFAVVIVDRKRRSVLLARDAIGVRPLYFATNGIEGIAFASLPCALTVVRQLAPEPNREAILRELVGVPSVAPATCFRHISLVPRGTVVRFEDGQVAARRYWRPGVGRSAAESEEGWVDAFRSALDRSTASKLDNAPRPVGIALSGGLDSASVVAAARPFVVSPTELLAVTAAVPGASSGDEPFARTVARDLGVPLECFSPVGDPVPDDYLAYAPNPAVAAHGSLLLEIMSRGMRGGCRLVLTGAMGDFVGGSTPNWRVTLLHEGGPQQLWKELRADRRLTSLGRCRAMAGSVLAYGAAAGWVPYRCVPELRAQARDDARLLGLVQAREGERRALTAELRDYGHGWDKPQDDVVSYAEMVMDRGTDHELCLLDLVSRYLGLECSHPFADAELVDLFVALPWTLRRVGGRNRMIQRRALEGRLPRALLDRREKLCAADYFSRLWRTWLAGSLGSALGPASDFVSPTMWSRYVGERERLSYPVLTTMNQVLALDRWLSMTLVRGPTVE